MSYYINKAILVGKVQEDSKIRTNKNGKKYASFKLTTSKKIGQEYKTEWHNITVWNEKLVENIISPYIKNGMKIHIEGEIETEKYTDKNGIERYQTKIIIGYNGVIKIVDSGTSKEVGKNESESVSYNFEDDIAF